MASNPPEPTPVEIRQALDLPPREAIRFLEEKGYRTTVNWTEMWEGEHASAFTVAKVAKVDLLVTIRQSLLKAQSEGTPYEQWLADLQPELERAGWWGRVQDRELTGTERAIIIGPRRLRTIYDTNMRMARATALWDRIQASKGQLPYLRYSAVMDGRTRPLHALWHGTILPVDHPWWLTHFPPNGWRCRCTVVQLNDRMLARRGWTVSKGPPDETAVRAFWRRGAKEPVFVPGGIDPGFGYNPGIARQQALMEKAAQTLADAAGAGLGDAALGEITGPTDSQTRTNLLSLIAAGALGELGQRLGELLFGGTATAATLAGDDLETAARKRRARSGGSGGLSPAGRESLRRHAEERRGAMGRFEKQLDATPQEVSAFVASHATGPTPGVTRLMIQRVGLAEGLHLEAGTGRKMTGWRRTLSNFEARKIMNKHGHPLRNYPRQVPLLPKDFEQLAEVQRRGLMVKFKRRPVGRKPSSIELAADIGSYRYVVVERLHPKTRELRVWSFWKEQL